MENPAEERNNQSGNNLIYIAVIASIAFWVFDSMIDTYLFMEGSLLENLTGLSIMEIWMRVAIMIMIIGFAVYSRKKLMERDRLIIELQGALDQIKTLKGLIPICSYCKNIRDDKGIWNKIESYLAKEADADFTHGMCPECATKVRDEAFKDS